jgi:hypothetical protein
VFPAIFIQLWDEKIAGPVLKVELGSSEFEWGQESAVFSFEIHGGFEGNTF